MGREHRRFAVGAPRVPLSYRRGKEAEMSVGNTVRWVGKSARDKAESMAHDVKDRALERRLDRATVETDRLRTENDLLRDEVTESRAEHRRILDLIEERFNEMSAEDETTGKKRSHKGRWFLFLIAVGGGVYYWFRQRSAGSSGDEWTSNLSDMPAVTETGTTTTL